jgi:hypothetical protein
MPRSMVGLLAAVGTVMSALVAFTHGDLVWELITAAAAANGLAVYLPLSHPKKRFARFTNHQHPDPAGSQVRTETRDHTRSGQG